MAAAFPSETHGNSWWSVKMANPDDEVPKSVPYIPLKESTCQTGYPLRIFQLLQRSENGKIGLTEWIARLVNICMIEAGFIPMFHDQYAIPVDELMLLSYNDIMIRLIAFLDKLVEKQKHLKAVRYTFVERKDKNLTDDGKHPDAPSTSGTVADLQPSGKKLSYSLKPVTLMVMKTKDDILVAGIANGEDMSETLEVSCFEFMKNADDFRKNLYHSLQYIYYGKFKAMKFVDIVKRDFVYFVLDKLNGEHAEVRGFQNLPVEMLRKLAEYFDFRSFINFLSTSRKHRDALDTDEMWKVMYRRLPEDLRRYGLHVVENVLDEADVRNPTIYRDMCLIMYTEALSIRRQHGNVWSRIPLDFHYWPPLELLY
ncbi:unnamed protein product [Orchesella dallaii]|uniref:F-box domain-containing protein n=1 Tax=Orchesella dallaii TaxID=48710 RepID=A0ABP1R8U3_9HEXA